MGIVKISEDMHEALRMASQALGRSINGQAEHWMRVGMLAELHPELDHSDISRMLIRAEYEGGLDLPALAAGKGTAGESAASANHTGHRRVAIHE